MLGRPCSSLQAWRSSKFHVCEATHLQVYKGNMLFDLQTDDEVMKNAADSSNVGGRGKHQGNALLLRQAASEYICIHVLLRLARQVQHNAH